MQEELERKASRVREILGERLGPEVQLHVEPSPPVSHALGFNQVQCVGGGGGFRRHHHLHHHPMVVVLEEEEEEVGWYSDKKQELNNPTG